jgi:hypothetical protein
MSELENFSNEELRIELLKFGLNMPVTSTTRKVLIKKLKIAKDQKAKTLRRRAIDAVMRLSDDEVSIEERKSATTTTQSTDSPSKS